MIVRTAGALMLAVILAACEGIQDPTTQLTQAEALFLAGQILAVGEQAAETDPPASASAPGSAFDPFSFEHESTHPCPSGGNLALSLSADGDSDEETGAAELDITGTIAHADCAYPHSGQGQSGGLVITVDGEPGIDFAIHVATQDGEPSEPFTFDLDGNVSWSTSDGRSGTCLIQFAAVTDFIAQERTVDGNICGHTVQQTLTWT